MKADLLFLNNKAMEELGVLDMRAVMHDVVGACKNYKKAFFTKASN